MLLEWPGMDERGYRDLMGALELGGAMFPGAVLHLAGPTRTGWRAVDVWDSPEAFERFRAEKLAPAMARVGLAAPELDAWPVANLAVAPGRPAPQG
jgi:hypothetical protein